MSEWLQSALLDQSSPSLLGKDLFVGLFSSLIGAIFSIAIITPLTARYVRLQDNRSWRSTRLYYVDNFAQQIWEIGIHMLAIREKISHEYKDDDYSPEIVTDVAESVSDLIELSITKIDAIFNTFNNSAYAFNAECHFLFADFRKKLTRARSSYASRRVLLPSDAVETVNIDYMTTDRLLIENKEGVVVLGSLFASDVAVAWRKSGRNTILTGRIDDMSYMEIFTEFERFAKFACGKDYADSSTIRELREFHLKNRSDLDSTFDRFDDFCRMLRFDET